MTLHIAECVLGVFAFDDSGNLVTYERFPRDPAEIAGRLATVQMGSPTPEHRKLLKSLQGKGEKLTLESPRLVEALTSEFEKVEIEYLAPNKAGTLLRGKLADVAEEIGVTDVEALQREVSFLFTKIKLKHEASQRDRLIIYAVGMLDEVDKFTNVLISHLREWYSHHFPELDRLVPDHQLYLKLVSELGSRKNFTESTVKSVGDLPQDRAKRIADAASSSLGATFDDLDLKMIEKCVSQIFNLQELREQIAEYVEGLMSQIAPNLRTLAGGTVGARLISLAGSLSNLSRLPASTIQVLGAEKALFRSLRTKAKPPKHGAIYQHPSIRTSPKKYRGKIARALAGKIAIAARVDAMAGEFVGDRLLADFKSRVSNIIKK